MPLKTNSECDLVTRMGAVWQYGVVLVAGVLLIGCGDSRSQPAVTSTATPTVTPFPTATVTRTVTATPVPSSTPIPGTATATPTPTVTCYTPATKIPDLPCDPTQCTPFARCAMFGFVGQCMDDTRGQCVCFFEGPTFTITPMSCPTATPTVDIVSYCGARENVGGCCDFGGEQPCRPLRFGSDATGCRFDGGYPHGCTDFPVMCNEATGLCE